MDRAHVALVVPVVVVVHEPVILPVAIKDGSITSPEKTPVQSVAGSPVLSPKNPGGVLIIAPYASYRLTPFIEAARKLDANIVVASAGPQAPSVKDVKGVHIDFQKTDETLETLLEISRIEKINAVIGTDDTSVLLANNIAARLKLPHNDNRAILATRKKDLARKLLHDGGIKIPEFCCLDLDQPLAEQVQAITYPCVVKPVNLSMSRGVIRADNVDALMAACARIETILLHESKNDPARMLLVEDFTAGPEIALEGILYKGVLTVLAIFDKPDLMDGPFFEETYYTTPSRLNPEHQTAIIKTISDACQVMGLREGPVHAECRVNDDGVWVLELAARTIGGMCSKLFEFATGQKLETVVVNHALNKMDKKPTIPEKNEAAGVMMIPTPKAGILRRVEGLSAATKIKNIDEVIISVREGYELVPLPEGASYLGFIFATAANPALVEKALRAAYAELTIVVAPLWKGQVVA